MTDEERWQLFPIILSEYQPAWPENYRREKARLEQAIGLSEIVRINHIGSTAVPGLIAKPTIDVLLEIQDAADTSRLISVFLLKKGLFSRILIRISPEVVFSDSLILFEIRRKSSSEKKW